MKTLDSKTLISLVLLSLKRHKILSLFSFILILVPIEIVGFMKKPVFVANSTVLIKQNNYQTSSIGKRVYTPRSLGIQMTILKSRFLAAHVVDNLPKRTLRDLEENSEYMDYKINIMNFLRQRIGKSPIVVWRFLFVSRLPLFGWKQRTLILGTFQISKILEELNRFRHNIRIQGVVDPQKLKDFDLVKYALENRIHSIVISLKDRRGTLPIQNILACKMHGINVMEWATFCEKNMNMIDIMNINPSHLVLGDGFQRNRMTIVIKEY